jgi:hypothetical protein
MIGDLEQVAALVLGKLLRPPVVDDEKIDPGERLQYSWIATIVAGPREGGEQLGCAMGEAFAAGLVAEGTGEPALADPAGPVSSRL